MFVYFSIVGTITAAVTGAQTVVVSSTTTLPSTGRPRCTLIVLISNIIIIARVAKRAKVLFSHACVTHSVQLEEWGMVRCQPPPPPPDRSKVIHIPLPPDMSKVNHLPLPPDRSKVNHLPPPRRRYASYWDAILLIYHLIRKKEQRVNQMNC